MKTKFKVLFSLWATLLLAGIGCGSEGGGGSNTFTVVPGGPTVVLRGGTLQFDTTPTGLAVAWSIVGGGANGTIDQNGLYTSPNTLPVDTQVTVQATFNTLTATGLVDLRAADTLAFGAAEMVNDTAVPVIFVSTVRSLAGVNNRINGTNGSLQVNSSWTGLNPMAFFGDVFFNQALDLNPFGPERNLTNDMAFNQLVTAMDTNNSLNPGILYLDTASGPLQLTFLGSSDQGTTFNAPVVIDPSGMQQAFGDIQFDDQGRAHVVYDDTVGVVPEVQYSQSTNNGVNWSTPTTVAPSFLDNFYCRPNIAVSSDGNTVHICYAQVQTVSCLINFLGDIKVATSTDGGNSFPTTTSLTTSVMAGNCNVDLDSAGNLYVSYHEGGEVMLATSTNGGQSFSTPVMVNSNATNLPFVFPFMGIDDLDRIDLIWDSDPNSVGGNASLRHARSLDGGQTFSQDVEIANRGMGNFILGTGLDHDESGRTHVQYWSDNADVGVNYDIFYLLGE